MIYELVLCAGMFFGLCGQSARYDYPSFEQCEQARKSIPATAIGSGYAICKPKTKDTK